MILNLSKALANDGHVICIGHGGVGHNLPMLFRLSYPFMKVIYLALFTIEQELLSGAPREPTGKDTVKSAFRSEKLCQYKKFGASCFDTLFSISEICRLSYLKADLTVSFL